MRYEPVQPWEIRRTRGERKGTRALLDVMVLLYRGYGVRNGGIYNRRRQRGGSAWSLHAVGRAFDLMVPATNIGDHVATVVVNHAEPLGVCEVIWNRKRWTPEKGWQHYGGVNPHTDHVHVGQSIEVADSPASLSDLHKWFTFHLTGKAS